MKAFYKTFGVVKMLLFLGTITLFANETHTPGNSSIPNENPVWTSSTPILDKTLKTSSSNPLNVFWNNDFSDNEVGSPSAPVTPTRPIVLMASGCNNVNNGGSISGGMTGCGEITTPSQIQSTALPSGGSGDLEYIWMWSYQDVPNYGDGTWHPIPGTNSPNYTPPGPITQTTYFLRCSRRSGCGFYPGETGNIGFVVNPGLDVACSVNQTLTCGSLRTQTQGGWGTAAAGNNPGVYRDANFDNAFPNGLTIGCSYTLTLSSSADVQNFIPSGSTPSFLTQNYSNPTSYNNVLAGQLVAATLSVQFDATDPSFGASDVSLGAMIISTGTFQGMTVNEVLVLANSYFGGCGGGTYTPSQFNTVLTSINENYVDGTSDNGFLECPIPEPDCTGHQFATVSVSGGTAPYTYLWSNNETSAFTSPLEDGTYSVTVTDANGCSATCQVTIENPPPFSVQCSSTDDTCEPGYQGSVSVTQDDDFSYSWVNDIDPNTEIAASSTVSGLEAGSYTVTVTDENGCTATCSATVGVPPCCNVTDPGEIDGGLEVCGSIAGPVTIGSSEDPSGGQGDLEIVWMVSDTLVVNVVGNPYWSLVPGENDLTLTIPGPISESKYYIRCARRAGCTNFYTGESNTIGLVVHQPPVIECVAQNGECGAPGSASVSVISGTSPYTYAWSNGATTASISNLDPGTYSVVVTDANGCTDDCSVSVGTTAPPLVDIVCGGDPFAFVGGLNTVENATGCGVLDYAFWSNNLLNGYGVDNHWSVVDGSFIENLNGTAIFTGSFVNNDDSDLSFDFNVVFSGKTYSPPTGSPKETGGPCSADVDNTDWYYYTSTEGTLIGTGDLTGAVVSISRHGPAFQIGTGANENDATVFGASGWLDCVVVSNPDSGPAFNSNAGHCDFNISLPFGPQFGNETPCTVICSGDTVDLFASAMPVSGSYTYLWSTGETTASISVSPTATTTYSVTVTDLTTNCTTTTEITVTVNDAPVVTCLPVNGQCGALGSASVAISGGSGDYTYAWSTGATSASITGLTDGDYSVIVTDNETGCSDDCEFSIANEPALVFECSSENGQCGEPGSASVNVTSGAAPYSYSWKDADNNEVSTSADASNLADGTYTVTVTDANGCSDTCMETITNEPALVIDCSSENGECGAPGSASVSVISGASPYTFVWSNGATTASISNLDPGTYSVVVTDANGCTDDCSVSVGTTAPPLVDIVCGGDPFAFVGGNNTVENATGCGVLDYAFWSNNLLNGYGVDNHWSVVDGSFIENLNGTAIFTGSFVNNDDSDLSFDFNVVFSGKTYSPPTGSPKETGGPCSQDVDNTDWYYYTSTEGTLIGTGDLTGAVVSISRHGPAFQIGTGANENDATVFGASGWLDCVVVSNPDSGPAFNSNAGHCDFNISLPNGPQFGNETPCTVICSGDTVDLFASAMPVSGSYTYLWSTGETTASISVSPTETTIYTVTITDTVTGCVTVKEITITVNDAPVVTCLPVNGQCGALGSASVAVSGGSGDYTYAWSTGATTASITGLTDGDYSVIVTDNETGCSDDCEFSIANEPALVIDCSSENGQCGALGSASVSVTSGAAPYSYSWKDADNNEVSTSADASNLADGTYTVTVTDANGCSDTCMETISNEPALVIDCSSENGECGAPGSASVSVISGTSPYTYAWSNGATTASISNLDPGTYSVVVTDANGCTDDCSVSVGTTAPPLVDIVCGGDPFAFVGGNNTVENATGCNGLDYAFWSNSLVNAYTSGKHWSISNGSFIENLNGTAIFTGSLTNNADNNVSFDFNVVFSDKTFTAPSGSPKEDELCVGDIANSDWYYYQTTNGTLIGTGDLTGAVVTISRHGPAFQIGTGANLNDENVFGASGWLDFEIVSNPSTGPALNANSGHCDFNFALPNGPQFGNETPCTVICSGDTVDLFASAMPVSGSYTYLWSTGETTASISVSPTETTIYTVTITDTVTGCVTVKEITVTVNDAPTIVCSSENGECGELGAAWVEASGGSGSYSYLWSNSATTDSISGLADGTYSVVVTDDQTGCSDSCSVTIANEPALEVECASVDGECGELGSASVSIVSGGTEPYAYLWSNGATTASISGLDAGSYSVVVTDAKGCSDSCSVSVGTTAPPLVDIVCGGGDPSAFVGGLNAVENATGCGVLDYAFWSNTLVTPYTSGKHWSISDGSFIENLDGTAIFTGSLTNNADNNVAFDFNVVFSDKTFTAPTGSPKEDELCVGDIDNSDWYYYQTTNGTLTGTGDLAGAIVTISRHGPAFQVGTGANLNDENVFGASGWLDFEIVSNPTSGPALNENSGHCDFNFTLPFGPQFGDENPCTAICIGETVDLFAWALPDSGSYTYLWSTGETDASISVTPAITTEYSVIVSNESCSTTETITITVEDCDPVYDCPALEANIGDACTLPAGGEGIISANCECEPTAPVNDACGDALVIQCGASPLTVSSDGSMADASANVCGLGNNGLWFSFVGTGGDITITSPSSFDTEMSVNIGTCDGFTNIACIDDEIGNPETYTVESSVDGAIYFVYIAGYLTGGSITGDITVSIDCAEPPACDAPTLDLSVVDANGDAIVGCLPSDGEYYVNAALTGGSGNDSYDVAANGGDSVNVLAEGSTLFGPFDVGTDVDVSATGADDAQCGADGSVDSPALCPPDNETCEEAVPVVCNQGPFSVSSVGSTATAPSGCSIGDNGVWFEFEGTGGDIEITTNASFDHKMSINSGSCDELTNLDCEDDGFNGDPEVYTIESSEVGTNYYVYVAYWGSSSLTGDISISISCAEPPACDAPTLDLTVVDANGDAIVGCLPSDGEYYVNAALTGGSGNDSYDVAANGGDSVNVLAEGSTLFGPFDVGTDIDVSATGADDAQCGADGSVDSPVACLPDNDDCVGAEPLTCGQPVIGSTAGATASGLSTTCGIFSSDDGFDQFYSFEADGESSYTISLDEIPGSGSFDGVLFVYTGTCENLTSYSPCSDNGTPETIELDAPPAGTYYVRLFDYIGTAGFELNLDCTEPPACDAPTLDLTVVAANGDAIDGCLPSDGEYYVNAALTGGSGNDSYDVAANGGDSVNVLAEGSTLFGPFDVGTDVDVSATGADDAQCGADGSIDSPALCPPDNETCEEAVPVVCNQGPFSVSSVGSTATAPSGCSIGDNGVWFDFEGTGGDIEITTNASFDHKMSINSGSCDELTNLDCEDDGFNGDPEVYTIESSEVGTNYYVYVAYWGSSSLTGDISISISCAEPPVCDAPILDLIVVDANGDAIVGCLSSDGEYYVNAALTGGSGNDSYDVAANGGDSVNVLAEGSTLFGPFDAGTDVDVSATGADDAQCGADGSIDSPALCPPNNDDCDNAIAIELGEDVFGNNTNATPDGPGMSCTFNGDAIQSDIWYSFVAPENGNLTIETFAVDGSGFSDTQLQLLEGGCDGNVIACDDDGGASLRSKIELACGEYTPGQTYLIQLDGYSGDSGSILLTVTSDGENCVEYDCPVLEANIGSPCDDGDPTTVDDIVQGDCSCSGVPEGSAIISGLTDWNGSCGSRSATITLYEPGTGNMMGQYNTTINSSGEFTVSTDQIGIFDIVLKVSGYLSTAMTNHAIADGMNNMDCGSLLAGDVNNDNVINLTDMSTVNQSFGATSGAANFNSTADFNCDGSINMIDVSILNASYGQSGDTAPFD